MDLRVLFFSVGCYVVVLLSRKVKVWLWLLGIRFVDGGDDDDGVGEVDRNWYLMW